MSGLHRIDHPALAGVCRGVVLAALFACTALPAHAGGRHRQATHGLVAHGASGAAADGQVGMASYYSSRFSGRRTASGERFDPSAMTAAHMTLPLGTRVRITNLKNGQSVVVRINDRGGFRRHGRILDLSPAAARALSMTGAGVARVGLKRVGGDS